LLQKDIWKINLKASSEKKACLIYEQDLNVHSFNHLLCKIIIIVCSPSPIMLQHGMPAIKKRPLHVFVANNKAEWF
jgi:hypothetical protein